MKKTLSSFLSLILTFSFFFVGSPKVHAASPTDFVSCWGLEETSGTRVDANTTNSNDLTDVNTVLYAVGKVGNAADFEVANSEYLNITDANQVGLDFTSDFSFSVWAQPESQHDGAMWYKWGASQAAYGFLYVNKAGTYNLRFNGYSTGAGANKPFDWPQTLSNATWYHIVLRFDALGHASGNGTAELFVNGSSLGTVTDTTYTGSANTTGAFSISALGSGIQWYWDGLLDQVEAYNRLLTNTEISDLYNAGTGVNCARTGGVVPSTPPFQETISYQ